jgi:hypothetical protein
MDNPKPTRSKRFSVSRPAQVIVPAVLVLLAIGLVAALTLILLAVLGLTPGV